jgi:hypothetical protein
MKVMRVNGLCSNGVWVNLIDVPLVDGISAEDAERAVDAYSKGIRGFDKLTFIGIATEVINFNPTDFLAMRFSIVE